MKLSLVEDPDDALRKAILAPLRQFNDAAAGDSGHRLLAVSVTDAAGQVRGGLWGATAYGWLYIQLLAVPELARGQGVGRQLMQAAENEALNRSCKSAWVDTIFGARGFYERLGYAAFGELPNYVAGFSRCFLKKDLAP